MSAIALNVAAAQLFHTDRHRPALYSIQTCVVLYEVKS